MKYAQWGREVLSGEIDALKQLHDSLGGEFEQAVKIVRGCKGKVVVTGLGKSGHIGRKISATLASLGTPSFFLHSAEALHGDSGMMRKPDVLIAISNSGGTREVVDTAAVAKKLEMKVISMTGRPDSALGQISDVVLNISVQGEADHLNLAPTSSSTVTLALGDALAVAVARSKDFSAADFAFYHAGGALGKTSRRASGKK